MNSDHRHLRVALGIRQLSERLPKVLGITFLLFATQAIAPPSVRAQEILWYGVYGDVDAETALVADRTADGGFVLFGYEDTSSPDRDDFLLKKMDALGNEQWSRSWGGVQVDWGFSVRQLPDEGYVLAGRWGTHPQRWDAYLARTDAQGNLLWSRQYGDNGIDERAHSVWPTSDGGFIFVGQQWVGDALFGHYDIWLVKTNDAGDVLWDRLYGRTESHNDVGLAVEETDDGGYIIGGVTHSAPWSCYLLRTDSVGNVVWENVYGGGISGGECNDVHQTADGGFIGTGCATPNANCDLFLVRTDADGNSLWERNFGGGSDDLGQSVIERPDGGFAVAGQTGSEGAGSWDAYVVRTDSEGNEMWTQTFGGPSDDRGWTIMPTNDGHLAVAGWTASPPAETWLDVLLFKLRDSSAAFFSNGFESGDTSGWSNSVP